MKFSYNYILDPANKMLICEAFGDAHQIVDIEHMLKTIAKMARENQVNNIVLDCIKFKLHCSHNEIATLLITLQKNEWFEGLKLARIIKPESTLQNVFDELAESLFLPIRDFETRSEAMLWLLFNKVRE